ncbi:MAG: exodeoxyribonuclease V subunit alpha [Planctomycetota bacterium]|nr:MAG: exodeoxyribonuclease V subunit alpha [Planctomycetota bacterium]
MIEANELDSLIKSRCPDALFESIYKINDLFDLKPLYYFSLFDLYEVDNQLADTIFPEIYFCLIQSVIDGSSCLSLYDDWCLGILKKLNDVSNPKKMIGAFIDDVEKGNLKKIIQFNNSENCPFILSKKEDSYFLYFEKYHQIENSLNKSLEIISQHKNKEIISSDGLPLDEILKKNPLCYQNSSPYSINNEQLKSIEMVLQNQFSIITGGPGTGKTFILFSLLRILIRNGYSISDIALAAPTGKAANRMMESIQQNLPLIQTPNELDNELLGISCVTIHRLLGITKFRVDGKFHNGLKLPFRILIIDEASMIDMSAMNNILIAIDPDKTKLLLIGDKDQLPSVELGAVLSDLTSSKSFAEVTTLKTSYRSKEKLKSMIESIKDFDGQKQFDIPMVENIDAFLNEFDEGCALLDLGNKPYDFFLVQLSKWICHNYADNFIKPKTDSLSDDQIIELLRSLNSHQVLSAVNSGLYGVDKINSFFIQEISNRFSIRNHNNYFHGMPIHILKNNYDLELFNGDFGLIMEVAFNDYVACFLKNGKVISVPVHLLPPYQPGFVTTIHKSQGSEYDELLLIIPPEKSFSILNKQLLYTGVSRAKNKCLIVGSEKDFFNGMKNNYHRTSGISNIS